MARTTRTADAIAAAASLIVAGPDARSITAAARTIDVTTRDGRKLIRKPEQWQEDSWAMYDVVPPWKFSARFMGNAMSKLGLYGGIVVDRDAPPVPVEEAAELTGEERPPWLEGLTPDVASVVNDELGRVDNMSEGQGGIMREFGIQLSITGDSYLVARTPDGEDRDAPDAAEEWQVLSTSALTKRGENVVVKETPNDKGTPLVVEGENPDLVIRVWRRHSRWPGLADSNFRAALDTGEELLIFARQMRAVGKSRSSAGVFLLPTELDFAKLTPSGASEAEAAAAAAVGQDGLTDLERGFVLSMTAPTMDDSNASSVAPHLLRGKSEHLKEVRYVEIGRKIDENAIARMDWLVRYFAQAIEIPVEILTGLADANHWTGWLIEDTTYKSCVEPVAQIPATGIASEVLRPAIIERGVGLPLARRIVVGLDPSALVVRPNRRQDALDAFEKLAISWKAFRQYLGLRETDAPDEQELMARMALQRGITTEALTRLLLEAGGIAAPGDLPIPIAPPADGEGGGDEPAEGDDGGGEEGGEPTPSTEPARTLALVAAARRVDLGDQLASIEQRLRERLMMAASAGTADALRRAGSRLRGSVQGDPEAREAVRDVEADQVGVVLSTKLGRDVDPEVLLDGAFEGLREQWDAWVAQAQTDVARLLTAHVVDAPDPGLAQDAVETYWTAADQDRENGWEALLVLLLGLASEQLTTLPTAVPEGEWDPTVRVPAGVIREALAVAGGQEPGAGAPLTGSAQQAGPGGLTTGPRVRATMTTVGLLTVAYRWTVGFPTRPFHPHQALAGATFTTWEDEVLTNGSGWPSNPYYFPGDHRGCQCDAVPEIVRADRAEESADAA